MVITTDDLFYFSVSELGEVWMNNLYRVLDLSHFDVVLHFSVIDFTQNRINLGFFEVDLQLFSLVWSFIILFFQLFFRSWLLLLFGYLLFLELLGLDLGNKSLWSEIV